MDPFFFLALWLCRKFYQPDAALRRSTFGCRAEGRPFVVLFLQLASPVDDGRWDLRFYYYMLPKICNSDSRMQIT